MRVHREQAERHRVTGSTEPIAGVGARRFPGNSGQDSSAGGSGIHASFTRIPRYPMWTASFNNSRIPELAKPAPMIPPIEGETVPKAGLSCCGGRMAFPVRGSLEGDLPSWKT